MPCTRKSPCGSLCGLPDASSLNKPTIITKPLLFIPVYTLYLYEQDHQATFEPCPRHGRKADIRVRSRAEAEAAVLTRGAASFLYERWPAFSSRSPPVFLQYAFSLHLPDTDSYAPWECRWLDKPDTLPRYLRASKWRLDEAQKRIKGTIEWRREYKPELIPPDEVKIEAATGKM